MKFVRAIGICVMFSSTFVLLCALIMAIGAYLGFWTFLSVASYIIIQLLCKKIGLLSNILLLWSFLLTVFLMD